MGVVKVVNKVVKVRHRNDCEVVSFSGCWGRQPIEEPNTGWIPGIVMLVGTTGKVGPICRSHNGGQEEVTKRSSEKEHPQCFLGTRQRQARPKSELTVGRQARPTRWLLRTTLQPPTKR
ncbi:hypothetical protein TWF481_007264 [Arthrobotrys musiformis]|uniref:Uncharacterized protein n=1 Tax=Arthrobotrys musiformis TaxID=47236 RepID=A0AAV9WBT6_9PEZI